MANEPEPEARDEGSRGGKPSPKKERTGSEGRARAAKPPGSDARAKKAGTPSDGRAKKAGTPSDGRPRKAVTPSEGRAKSATPDPGKRRRIVLAVSCGALVLVAILGLVAWRMSVGNEREARWQALRAALGQAKQLKSGHDVTSAATVLARALDGVRGLEPEPENQPVQSEAVELGARLDEFVQRASQGDEGLRQVVETTKDPELGEAAFDGLARSKDPKALAPLVASKDGAISSRALSVACALGGDAAVEAIDKALDLKDEKVAHAAALESTKTTGLRSWGLLAKAAERYPRDVEVGGRVGDAIAHRDPTAEATADLARLARSPQLGIWEPAVAALAKLARPVSAREIVRGLDAQSEIQQACLTALEKIGAGAVPALAEALDKGQTTAALALASIGTPAACEAIGRALAQLSWSARGLLFDQLLSRPHAAPPMALRAAVGKTVSDARDAIEKRDPSLDRTALTTVVLAAKVFGFPDAAASLRFDLKFMEFEDKAAAPINKKGWVYQLGIGDKAEKIAIRFLSETGQSARGELRLELRNKTPHRFVVYADGPTRVELRVGANKVVGRNLAAGKYRLGVALADRDDEALPSVGNYTFKQGSVIAFAMDELGELLARQPRVDAAPVGDRQSHAEDLDRFIEEERAAVAARLLESPWTSGALQLQTEHYLVMTDAGGAALKDVAQAVEDSYARYAKQLSSPGASERFVVRFFAREADCQAWRRSSSLLFRIAQREVREWRLAERAKQQGARCRSMDPTYGPALELVGDALAVPDLLEGVGADELLEFDVALGALEGETDPRAAVKLLGRALAVVRSVELIEGLTSHLKGTRGQILGYHQRARKELCFFDHPEWRATLRHEAFHQFLVAWAPKAPAWIHEGFACHFEAFDQGGLNKGRLADLKMLDERGIQPVESLSLRALLTTEQLGAAEYAFAWSFVYYLNEKEPALLGKILLACKEALVPQLAIVSAFPDLDRTEAAWRQFVRKLIR